MEVISHDSYNSSPHRGGTELAWTRVYTYYGKVAHLKELAASCKYLMWMDCDLAYLLGTGSQDEFEKAAAMRLCRECFRIRELYANHPDPRLGMGHGVEMT